MPHRSRRAQLWRIVIPVAIAAVLGAAIAVGPTAAGSLIGGSFHGGSGRSNSGPRDGVRFTPASLDGVGNNRAHPTWGAIGQPYLRVAPTAYEDGVSAPVTGPNSRWISNRILNDSNQNVFSERAVTQWGWTWGQFLDHTFGLRDETGPTATPANIPFNADDPMETFTNTLGVIPFSRTDGAPGTGTSRTNPRQQLNTTSTFLNAFSVYSGSPARLDWLRAGPVDGNPTNNRATLLMPDNYLPRATARGDAGNAPAMAIDGRLMAAPSTAMIAGDVRANENVALTAVHTLFAREHNRIVAKLPASLSEEEKFQIARRIVIAEQQYVTYQEWLPSLGVALPRYRGYQSDVNPTLSTEFATVGYRVHSQIHGEFEFVTAADRYSAEDLAFFEAQGLEVAVEDDEVEIAVPLNSAYFNPDLFQRLEIGPLLTSLAESQYNNDEQMDNQLRSTLFQIPVAGNPGCEQGPELEPCFSGVVDLGALDIERARDHGIPRYNALRKAYGLAPRTSFTAITGEATDAYPADADVDSPASLDILGLTDIDGNPVEAGGDGATAEKRRSTVAARLKAIYGSPDKVDAFVGMIVEPHVLGSELGELELAMWRKQFQALRDGDRFFFGNDPVLGQIRTEYGIDYRRSLAEIIAANTDTPADEIPANVFLVASDDLPAASCTVGYALTTNRRGSFEARLTVAATTPLQQWSMKFQFANGQTIRSGRGVQYRQSGPFGRDVTLTGRRAGTVTLEGVWDGATNAKPPTISLNGKRCAVT